MSDSLLEVTVKDKKNDVVIFEIKIISPAEYYFYEKENFALQIIWEPIQIYELSKSSIARAISVDMITDNDWVLSNAGRYILAIEILSIRNYPDKNEIEKMGRLAFDDFRKKNGEPEAIFKIKVTDPKWVEHIKAGMQWKSTSFDMEY